MGMGGPTRFFSLLLLLPERLVFCVQVEFLQKASCGEMFFFLKCIYLGPCWGFVAARGPSLVAGRKGCSLVVESRLLTVVASLVAELRL